MKRRTFLKTAAGTAMAAPFLAREAFSAQDLSQIKHVVVVTMENRSFDHMLGWLPNADGKQAGLSYVDKNGVSQPTRPLAPDWTGCGFADPDHSYTGSRIEYNNGLMDGWLQTNDVYSIGYYVEKDLPFLSAFARNFTTCNRYFASIMGPTLPNRIFQHSGQTDRLDDSYSICQLPTIWDNLKAAGISSRYYYGNIPFLALYGRKYSDISANYSQFLTDCKNGALPSVSFVDPKFTVLLNFANDDHPHSDIRNGDAFLAQTYDAVVNSPNWPNTVFIVTRDEWGGFFEHVAPPRALAPNNVDPDLVDGKALLGMRVPTIVASPWNVGNPQDPGVNSVIFDHTSVLKLIETIWSLPPLGARETSSDTGNILSVLNLGNPPQTAPKLPVPGRRIPNNICSSSINPSLIGAPVENGPRSTTAFGRLLDSGILNGWPIYQ
jgi:phospholipase C